MDPSQQVVELGRAEHGLAGIVGVIVRGAAVAACIEEEELGGPLSEGEVRSALAMGRRIRGGVVVRKGVVGGHSDSGHVAVPVVLNLMVVDDMDPGEVVADCRPRWRRIDLAVLAPVGLCILTLPVGYVNIDEVA